MATNKLSSFGKAFREARQRGDKTFEFNGKKYTTELAEEKKSSPAPDWKVGVAPPPAEEDAETRQRRTTSREELISQIPTGGTPTVTGGERVSGSELGRQAKTTMGALGAATGAGAAGPAIRSAMNIGMYGRGAATGAKAAQEALSAPTKRLEGPSKSDLMARDRAAREAARREEMLEENARRYGLDKNAPGYEGASRAVRESLGDGNFTLRKKGGTVKATPSKPAAKGWGKARGARQAKYY